MSDLTSAPGSEPTCVECGNPTSGRKKYASGGVLCDYHYGLAWDLFNAEADEDYEWGEMVQNEWDVSVHRVS